MTSYPQMYFSVTSMDDHAVIDANRRQHRVPRYMVAAHWLTGDREGGTTPLPYQPTDDAARNMCETLAAKSGIRLIWRAKRSFRPRWETQTFHVPEAVGMVTPIQRLSELLAPISLPMSPETRAALEDIIDV